MGLLQGIVLWGWITTKLDPLPSSHFNGTHQPHRLLKHHSFPM